MAQVDLIRNSSREVSGAGDELCQGEGEEAHRSVWSNSCLFLLAFFSRQHAFFERRGGSLKDLEVISELMAAG